MITLIKRIKVDTIEFVISLPSNAQFSFLLGQLPEWKAFEKKFVPNGKITVKKGKYFTRMSYFPASKRMLASVHLGSTPEKKKFAKISLQIGKAKGSEFAKFQENLATLMEFFNYQKLFETAHVTRIDLAIDVYGRAPSELLVYGGRIQKSHYYDDGGVKGTLYLGSNKSNLYFRIYDRGAKSAGKGAPCVPCTRIEANIKNVPATPNGLLASLQNPFEKIFVADLKVARKIEGALTWWQEFLTAAEKIGSAAAMAELKKSEKKKARAFLQAARVPWWDAQKSWQALDDALAVLEPSA